MESSSWGLGLTHCSASFSSRTPPLRAHRGATGGHSQAAWTQGPQGKNQIPATSHHFGQGDATLYPYPPGLGYDNIALHANVIGKVKACDHITIEDKDPSILWACSKQYAFVRFASQLISSGRWGLLYMPIEKLLKTYRDLFRLHLPKSVQAYDTHFSEANLPYLYDTVKRKCWNSNDFGGAQKICEKPGHSCFRCISSFAAFPGKLHLKYASRALDFVISQTFASFDF